MGPISLSGGELAIWPYVAMVTLLVAVFVALFVSAMIGLGIGRLFYIAGNWCFHRVHASYLHREAQGRLTRKISLVLPGVGR
jgi:hypothetical protein